MTRYDLRPFFAPRSVAVVGAGERQTSSGGAVLQNLRISGFTGEIVPVNPKGGEMFGLAVRKSLGELNHPADLAVIVIRPDLILDAVREAAASGHQHLLILPGGFAEAGEAGKARDLELRRLIAAHGLTVVGPNCAGIIHLPMGARFAATFLRDMPPGPNARGAIAFVTQSGALAEEAIAAAHRLAIPLGTIVSVGNAVQLGIADYLEHLGSDPAVTAVLLYIESIEDKARFRAVARRVAAEKPVVALIGGRTGPGARAAAAHTGAPAQDDREMDAFAAECGVLRVESLRRLLLAAKGFGAFPQGIGKRALILSNSGGPGVLCTDRAAAEGLDIAPLPAAMAAALRAALPAEASVANPLDLLADAREDRFGLTLDCAIRDGAQAFDAILGIHVVPFMVEAQAIVATFAALARSVPMPFLHAMMGTLPDKDAWFASLERAGVPAFNDVEAMAECAGLLARYPALRERARMAET
ncbi:MAG TPA: CoA-binding protein [Stellaceae bacterium]|jgi:acyl-CoA synthetase (NDP forming)|nr:CoA-binding protein [Stellaceae bacterium]